MADTGQRAVSGAFGPSPGGAGEMASFANPNLKYTAPPLSGRNPNDVSTYATPDASWCTEGQGPLAGQLIGGPNVPTKFYPYTSSLGINDEGSKVNVIPLPDDFGNVWLVVLDGYDFAKLATYDRAAGADAIPKWNGLRARNYAEQAWHRLSDAYAATFPDAGSPTENQVGPNYLILPDDPVLQQYGIAAPAGTPYSIIGNIPLTIPANTKTGAPPIKMRITGDRFLRLAYFSSNADMRGKWDQLTDVWSALWDILKRLVVVALDVITERYDDLLKAFDYTTLPFFRTWTDYVTWMQSTLESDFGPNGPLLNPPAPGPSGSLGKALLIGGAIALVLLVALLGGEQKGK